MLSLDRWKTLRYVYPVVTVKKNEGSPCSKTQIMLFLLLKSVI